MSPLSVVLVKTSAVGWHLSLPSMNQDSHQRLFKAGRWERVHRILANRPFSALLCNQLVIRMPSFIQCVQWWLFLSKLWLVVCLQDNHISHCGSLLLFLRSLTDLLHHCTILVFVLKTFLSLSLKLWTPQGIQPVCYGFVRFQHTAMSL